MDSSVAESLAVPDPGHIHNSKRGCLESYNWKIIVDPPPENGNGLDTPDYTDFEEQQILQNDRRRAKSLPAYPEQANLFKEISQRCGKSVRFADALGLNLESVKHFNATDDPHIPAKAFSKLKRLTPRHDHGLFGELCHSFDSKLEVDRLVPTFTIPEKTSFETRVQRCRVALEKISITQFDVRGTIRALTSGSCKKEVGMRYTFNDWLSFMDVYAASENTTAAVGEKFQFTMFIPPFLDPGSSIQFALYSKTDCGEFWDNNDGENYTLKYLRVSAYETAAFHAT